jgi:hypothetical protein
VISIVLDYMIPTMSCEVCVAVTVRDSFINERVATPIHLMEFSTHSTGTLP